MSDTWMMVIIQIVVTWWAVESIKSYVLRLITALAQGADKSNVIIVDEIRRDK